MSATLQDAKAAIRSELLAAGLTEEQISKASPAIARFVAAAVRHDREQRAKRDDVRDAIERLRETMAHIGKRSEVRR